MARTFFCAIVLIVQICLAFKTTPRLSFHRSQMHMTLSLDAPTTPIPTPVNSVVQSLPEIVPVVAPYVPIPELRAPKDLFQNIINIGATKAKLSPFKTLILGIKSGCHISFGGALMLSVGGMCPTLQASSNPGLFKIVSGCFGLPLGLMMTLVCGGELFTGNTCFLTAAVAEKKATFKELFKNWSLSYTGNVIGSLFMAYLFFLGGTLGDAPAAANIAVMKCSLSWKTAFVRAVMGNWIVCMSILMATGSSSLASKMVAIFFPISAFVMLGLEHSIANLFVIPLGIMRGSKVTIADFLWNNLLPVTLGNIVGGAVCVGLAYSCIHGSLLERFKPAAKKN